MTVGAMAREVPEAGRYVSLHHERLEIRSETRLVLLGVAEEGGAGSFEVYDGFCGKPQGPGFAARLDHRVEEPVLLQRCQPGRLAGPPALWAVSRPQLAQPAAGRPAIALPGGHQR